MVRACAARDSNAAPESLGAEQRTENACRPPAYASRVDLLRQTIKNYVVPNSYSIKLEIEAGRRRRERDGRPVDQPAVLDPPDGRSVGVVGGIKSRDRCGLRRPSVSGCDESRRGRDSTRPTRDRSYCAA